MSRTYHKVNATASTQAFDPSWSASPILPNALLDCLHVSAGYNSTAASEPLGWTGIVERGRLRVELHVLWVDSRTVYPTRVST